MTIIPQPVLGELERIEEATLVTRDHVLDKDALPKFIPPMIPSTGYDMEDSEEEEEEEDSRKSIFSGVRLLDGILVSDQY